MQFIKNGPDIPEHLLQLHEDGRVVFFCGAGISYPAGLPGFRGLVEAIYTELGTSPTVIEDRSVQKEQFDATLDLLERRVPGQRAAVRAALAKVLKPNLRLKGATTTHAALLQLAKDRSNDVRLVTTNFDRIFQRLIARLKTKIPCHPAPLLPIPKNSKWNGLVYLHGLLPDKPDESALNRLVLSSGDFGLAYLTERWAARFVSELFRNYIVCFVGYSINDPVLRYMMDALAADRMLGESTPQSYAFGSYVTGGEKEALVEWEAKGVVPVLYEVPTGTHNHSALYQTIKRWADTHRDGVLGKERIVVEYAMAKPTASTRQDDFVGRMLWALSDKRALPAKRFADHDPLPPLDWLEPMTEFRFKHSDLIRFGVTPDFVENDKLAFSMAERPTPYSRAPLMKLVDSGYRGSHWDDVMQEIARWLARHIHDPRLVLWVAKHGGRLHHQFAWLIGRAIAGSPPPPMVRKLWSVVLAERLKSRYAPSDIYDWRNRFKLDGLTPTLRLQLRDILSPYVVVREPFSSWTDAEQGDSTESTRMKDVVDWEISLAVDHVHSALRDINGDPKWREALLDLLPDFVILLRDALDLMHELGGIDYRNDLSYIHQPSISEHPQNRDFLDWTALIELVREAWLVTAARFPGRARQAAEGWWHVPYPLFKRLTFFAAANSDVFSPSQSLGYLLSDDGWWMWSVETQREALRLLAALVSKLEIGELITLERAILKGPPRSMFKDDIDAGRWKRIVDHDIWLRLAKTKAAGATLGSDASAKLEALCREYAQWSLAEDERDEFPSWMGNGDELRVFHTTPRERRPLVAWLRQHQSSDHWQEDDWRQRCRDNFPVTACALIFLSREGVWPADRWREALQAWADEKLLNRSWRYMGPVLRDMPQNTLETVAHSLGWWLQAIAKTFKGNEQYFFDLIARILGLEHEGSLETDQPVSHALNHPIGHVTEAALRWWYRRPLEDGQGLPAEIKPIFTALCYTSIDKFLPGRVILASNLVTLFRVDKDWTTANLLPLLNWQESTKEARAAWQGFLRSPRRYPPLMEILKQPFLETSLHFDELGEYAKQYAAFLTFVALAPDNTFPKAELAQATSALPPVGLNDAAQALVRTLAGSGEQGSEYWRNRVSPYLKSIWPQSRSVITPTISNSMAQLCIAAKDAFPEAMNVLKHWLQPLEHSDYVVHLLHQSNVCERFPDDALTFLDTVIGTNPQWPPRDLAACLNRIRKLMPALVSDHRFQRLSEFLRYHG